MAASDFLATRAEKPRPKRCVKSPENLPDHFLAVTRAFLARLLMFHNAPANFPIRRRHQRGDDAGGRAPR